MRDLKNTCRVAVVQATPVMFRKEKCLEKALRLIDEAAGEGAELIVFPELFIPGYPYGMTFGFTVGSRKAVGREDWKMYYDNSLLADGPEMRKLLRRARELGVYISMGYSERDAVTGTLYNANMMISPEGEALNHRKLKPTGSERVVWGDADRDYFPVMDTPWGPMGNLICWESYMPLARVALYQKGISLYISPNTNDNPEWQDTIRHIAIEGHCYFINADLVFRRSDYPQTVSGTAGHRLPGRQLRHRPLRPRGLRHRLGQGGYHLRRPGYAEGPRQPYGAGLRGPLRPSRRAGAARQREIKRKRPPAGRAFLRYSSRTTRSTSAQSFWLLSLAIRSTS